MALQLYHDSACTNPVEAGDPDTVHEAVAQGVTLEAEAQLYVESDDGTLTYENITISGNGDVDGTTTSGEIDVKYAPDNSGSAGTYVQDLSLSDGAYGTSTPIWRKVIAPDVQNAFNETNITHQITADEYVA